MSFEQPGAGPSNNNSQRNYEHTLHKEATLVSSLENSGNWQAARDRLALDAQSMGANTTVAGAQAFRHMVDEIHRRENGNVTITEYNTPGRGDQMYVQLNRPNGAPGGAVLIDNLATRDLYASPQQAQPRVAADPAYAPERYPAPVAQGYPPPVAQGYPPPAYGYDARGYQPPQAQPVWDQRLPNDLNYPPPYAQVAPQVIIQSGFRGGPEPWQMRRLQHEEWEREHRFMHPYYGAGYGGGGYPYDYGSQPQYIPPRMVPGYYAQYDGVPSYYGQRNPVGSMIAGGAFGAAIGAIAGRGRGAAIGALAGVGAGALFG